MLPSRSNSMASGSQAYSSKQPRRELIGDLLGRSLQYPQYPITNKIIKTSQTMGRIKEVTWGTSMRVGI